MVSIDFNYIAVIVSAAVAFLLGALWYSPMLFGNIWVKAHGFSRQQLERMQQAGPAPYLICGAGYLVMALVISAFVSYTSAATLLDGLWLGLLFWVGFAGTIGLISNRYSDKSLAVYAVDTGYQLAYLMIMSVLLTLWH